MTEAILSGITFGLLLSVMLGPVFFALLQTSLHEGFKAGSHLAFGVFLSDTLLICLCYLFAEQLNLFEEHKVITAIGGGILLIGFGIYILLKKIKVKEVDDDRKTVHSRFVLEGFFLNAFNPAVLLFWLSVVSLVSVKEHYTRLHNLIFFSSILVTVFSTDLLKALIAHKIKNLLNARTILWINRITGLVLAVFGLHMIWKAFEV